MNFKLASLLAAGLFASAPTFAADVLVDFDGPASFDSIGEYYNGAVEALGVSFGLDALALKNDELGPYFSNAPSPAGVMTVVGTDATMNFAMGFTGASFSYSYAPLEETDPFAFIVGVYSGLNGTGTLLSAFAVVNNAQNGCNDSPYCNWNFASTSFNGVAKSIAFGSAVSYGIDNLTITAVPEPTQALMLALGLAAVLVGARRKS
ncbi:PEP-CTERM sorting domain-containing protein [Methyloversatilis sp. XJ19-13]|uniref:PEP-CTERM sorting domain-containing protein n=1 Tax=Methyloversatilis sp. XJ19-13 TaxID=2963430 RepID=UPI00211CA38B|nr:PEP-CTERM sorting domain-containing protein [Methyloversatilis sp. XJ19-13]MCQ9375612.1 PEP-CTERM sorting domain-containing protein [Methyloversatilis sp. XJ19-13]